MLPRRESCWNYLGFPKLPDRSQQLVGRSSPYYENMWRMYCCLTGYFPIVDTCLKPWFHVKIKLFSSILVFYFNMEPCLRWNKIILAAKIILFRMWFHQKIIFAKLRPWAELVAQAPAGTQKFLTFVCRQQPAAAWRLQYTNAAIGCNTASWMFMLKLFYFISDVVPC